MVRIKHRYLLLNILYPSTTDSKSSPNVPAYLKFNAPSPAHLSTGLFITHLRSHLVSLFGDYGLGLTTGSLKVVYFSQATSTAIVRCPRQHYRLVWAALTFMTELPGPQRGKPGAPCVVRVVRVSGTIRKSEEELMRRARKEIVRARMVDEIGGKHVLHRLIGAQAQSRTPTSSVDAHAAPDAGIEDLDDDEEMVERSDESSNSGG